MFGGRRKRRQPQRVHRFAKGQYEPVPWRRPSFCVAAGAGLTQHQQHLVVFVGMPGSGKSTASRKLLEPCGGAEQVAQRPDFVRTCQDEAGNRDACEETSRTALHCGQSVVVDGCNVNARQRSFWVALAREILPGTCCVSAVCLHCSTLVCCDRVAARSRHGGHETLMGPRGHTDSVVQQVASQLEEPTEHEGFDRVVFIETPEQLETEIRGLRAAARRSDWARPWPHLQPRG